MLQAGLKSGVAELLGGDPLRTAPRRMCVGGQARTVVGQAGAVVAEEHRGDLRAPLPRCQQREHLEDVERVEAARSLRRLGRSGSAIMSSRSSACAKRPILTNMATRLPCALSAAWCSPARRSPARSAARRFRPSRRPRPATPSRRRGCSPQA
jgi:hypothetical protein